MTILQHRHVHALPAAGVVSPYSEAILHVSFNGETTSDISAAQHAGTPIGNPTYSTDTGNSSSHALSLNGTDQGVDYPGIIDAGGNGITIACWIYANSWSSAVPAIFVSKSALPAVNEESYHFMLGQSEDNGFDVLYVRLKVDGNTRTWIGNDNAANDLPIGAWTHVAFTFDGPTGVWRLYKNAVQVRSRTNFAGTISSDVTEIVKVGNDGANFFDGLIDDVFVATRAFSAAEIATLMNQAL